MTQDDTFDLSPEEEFDSFDPLADFDPADDDYDAPLESGVVRVDPQEFPTMEALAQTTEELACQPAPVRIATLLDNMQPSRKLLISVMGKCLEPCPNTEVLAFIADYQRNAKSIFTPDIIMAHLHRAGAVERLCEDGSSYEDLSLEPASVVVDGVEYLEPVEPPEIFWRTTPDGAEVVEGDRPAERLFGLLDTEPQYRAIYRTVLEQAAAAEGATEKQISALVNGDPVLEKPRMYAPRFISKLFECDALTWEDKRWHITELGRQALANLSD